jgi:lipopolysaccharide transport system ATP-binding protein
VGIIGRNGAGKSTLLKILSRITEPSEGRIRIRGRVASLLEVGTGFHPELTGRENIFLNGAILGMGRDEIRKRFDEIVAFAEVERFLDTPVKRYSSGMYVRLAFAVAAHLEPEILIIDEVLAVGDAQFQKKCLGKMEDVSNNEGRTVLFVSHNMGVITQLCSSGIYLKNGQIHKSGGIHEVIQQYLHEDQVDNIFIGKGLDANQCYIKEVKIVDSNGSNVSNVKHNESIVLEIDVVIKVASDRYVFGLALLDKYKRRVFTLNIPFQKFVRLTDREKKFQIRFPSGLFAPNLYSWALATTFEGKEMIHLVEDCCSFAIIDAGSDFASQEGYDYGCILLPEYEII